MYLRMILLLFFDWNAMFISSKGTHESRMSEKGKKLASKNFMVFLGTAVFK